MKKGGLFYVPLLVLAIFLLESYSISQSNKLNGTACEGEISLFRNTDLPTSTNALFAGSGVCQTCHNSMVNLQGVPIGIVNDWRSTMMANSAKDPLWQAKVSHEGLVNPAHKIVLEDVCTKCHAPAGNVNAHHMGQNYYSMAEMNNDPLARDGVQCTVCHQIPASSMGNFSGSFLTGTNKTIWGPFANPVANPMIFNTGYTPVYGQHINDSRLCGSCHTLITHSVDLNGNLTGEDFVEQAIYHEWKNSAFPAQNVSCQTCHVPRIDDPVKISSLPPWLQPRSPFAMHQLAGANVFMDKLLRDNGSEIGVTATTIQFDSTISRSTRMLQQQTLDMTVAEINRTNDTLYVDLSLKNKAGHKFPGGFPSRRAFVEVIATKENGDTIFHSGKTDGNFNLINENSDYEPHHNIISSESQVQIYEMVMGDINGNVTTVLERAYQHLKDNRLLPVGFKTTHQSYDTTRIVGAAATDPDFNKTKFTQGTGIDKIHYHIPLTQYYGSVSITAKVLYQTVNDKWLNEMFSFSSDAINTFRSYYNEADKSPVLVASQTLSVPAGYQIELLEGWNSLSCFIMPTINDIDTVLSQIIGSLIILTNDEGMIFPQGGVHTLTHFDPYKGYSLKLSGAESLKIRGGVVVNRELSLPVGWTLVPVLSGCDVEINNLNPIFLNQLEIIVEMAGYRVYWPDYEIETLNTLSPGKAYLVKMSNAGTISFPACN